MKIRVAKAGDAAKIAVLSGQLGYPISEQDAINHLCHTIADSDQKLFIAELDSQIVGWVHIQKETLFMEQPLAEITGLIVDDRHRKKNIGKRLVQESIQWAKQKGLLKIRVRSNVTRSESHSFYKAIGFREVKTQKVYEWTDE